MTCWIGAGVERRGAELSAVPSGFDETVGMRLGPLLRLPDGNLLGHQTGQVGPQGNKLLIFLLPYEEI